MNVYDYLWAVSIPYTAVILGFLGYFGWVVIRERMNSKKLHRKPQDNYPRH